MSVVKAVQINFTKCSFYRVARWFDFNNVITETKRSQQYVVLYAEMSHTLVF